MASFKFDTVQGRLPRFIAVLVLTWICIVMLAGHTLADPAPEHGDRGVRVGENSYQPYAATSGTTEAMAHRAISTHGRFRDSAGDGCVPRGAMVTCSECPDPEGAGCEATLAVGAVKPVDLARRNWEALRLPVPRVHTAPPRGSRGLVGLPEWVWVPGEQWRPMSKTASAGAVWARVTARPQYMVIAPDGGIDLVRCGGPGTAFDSHRAASMQHTDCSYTFGRSSATVPGGAYQVVVTVVWSGTWVGSGGGGGTLPDIRRSSTFTLKVAEGQGLYA
jgi:hypothetical protein